MSKKVTAARGTNLAPAPTTEIGAPTSAGVGVEGWGTMFQGDDLERAPELQWPNSNMTYAAMWNDSQVEGLMAGTTLPIRRYKWMIDPNGCDPAKVQLLAADLNLPILGQDDQPKRRSKGRFSHDRHLFHALKALGYGHYYMEQVAEIGPDGIAHLRKLAPRPPSTISEIAIQADGGLRYIKQNIHNNIGQPTPEIKSERLVAYVWDQEGANWFGRSMFRSIYKNWLIKDRLLRVDAIKHERNGVGTPVAFGAPGMGKTELNQLAALTQAFKAGESSGGALPNGTDLKLLGVSGSLPDTVASIRMHNEEMARRFLMMFMQLGESAHGTRALGDAFVDFFSVNQDATAKWYADTTTEHVLEDWWDWNVDPDSDQTPRLVYERTSDPRDAFGPFAQLVQTGAIQVDDEIENAVREAMDLPSRTGPRLTVIPGQSESKPPSGNGVDQNQPEDQTSPDVKAARTRPAGAVKGATSPAPLPDRPLRRVAAAFEVDAAVNFAEMDANWTAALDRLFNDYKGQVIASQLDELEDAIKKTSDLEKLAGLEAPALGGELILAKMVEMFNEGVRQAEAEAKAQGITDLPAIDPADHTSTFASRARATDEVNARTIGNMAGTKAIRLSGGAMTKAEVASNTREYVEGLKHAIVRDRLGGAITAAMNSGRRAFMSEAPGARYYSSELLDSNTCEYCAIVDGTEYNKLSDSERDYPSGGYVECSGGDRCRGTVVAVYGEGNA